MPYLNIVRFTFIHMCRDGLKWNLWIEVSAVYGTLTSASLGCVMFVSYAVKG
jgi:hypothetical protein